MFKRALVGAVCVFVAACSVDDGAEQQQLQTAPVSLFDPVSLTSVIVPLPFDAFFAGFNDPTLNIPNSNNAPFVTAANLVDGWSTAAPIFTDLVGFVDLDSANAEGGVIVINTATLMPLTPGQDYVVQGYPALDDADGVPINEKRTRLLIQPLKPLMPATRYIVALTRNLTNAADERALPSEQFLVAASDTPVEEQDAPILDFLTAGQRATLETLRSQIIRPTVEGLAAAGIPEQSLVLAWPFTTQSIGKTLAALQESVTPTTLGVQAVPNGAGGTLNTGNLDLNGDGMTGDVPGNADIYAGFLDVPYYGQLPSMENPTAPLTSFWQADATQPDSEATFLGQVPCGAFAAGFPLPDGQTAQPSASTTTCFPVPVPQSTQRIPVLVTVPNTSAAPAGGWPVVIFQHGITQNRSNLFPIAPALAQAGFLAIAIDHPLHGVAPCTPGTPGCLRIDGISERTFDVDYVNNASGAPGPDGTPDGSGTHYLNLSSLITGRDNVRQSVADLIQLRASLGALNANPATQVNTDRVGFVGHSLGGIVGGTFAGVNTDVGAFSLVNPGGGIAKLLDGSLNFGPVVAAGLAAAGFNEGGDTFETFLRFAQLVIDDGDPINYAQAAVANHPIHMISVDGDTVVPNNVPAGPTNSRNHLVTIPGPLSGTDPLAAAMGLEVIPVTPGVTMDLELNGDGVRAVTVLSEGGHSSILDPTASLAATGEIQGQIANFQASAGTCLPIGQNCPAPPPAAE